MLAELQLKSDKTLFERFLLCQHVMMSPVFTLQLSGLLECIMSESPAWWQRTASKVDQGRLNLGLGPSMMGQQVEVLASRPEDLSLIPMGWKSELTPTSCKLTYMCVCVHVHTHTHTHIHTLIYHWCG